MIDVFFSYAFEDRKFMHLVRKHLVLFDRQKRIAKWYDRLIEPGQSWKDEIDQNLRYAGIILVFVSPDFFASDYCYEGELAQALKQHKEGISILIPIIVRPCAWEASLFGSLQALPRDAKPIAKWRNKDEACLDVANGIMKVAETLERKSNRLDVAKLKPGPDRQADPVTITSERATVGEVPNSRVLVAGTEAYPTIQGAIRAARCGDTVRVPSGIHTENLTFRSGIRLIGESRDNTIVQCEGTSGSTLKTQIGDTGEISDITFQQFGEKNVNAAFSVIALAGASLSIRNCRILNGICYGIICLERDKSQIEKCEISGNGDAGVFVYNTGTVTLLSDNAIHDNATGILYWYDGGGIARRNDCYKNKKNGIMVMDSKPRLSENTCRDNGEFGIWISVLSDAVLDGLPNMLTNNGKGGACAYREE